ncbi:hypothetical protein A374_05361 [Fictibacillus macauensis ZFHKF-1]|uniref:RpiR family transcriptional regulator n=1 Tax=Fictibacillus macauensis ZFHKF-1 TaxID=1196324 RepID=I8J3L3_9BACL|nr:MurR/RpiR family transcriptional regulator [Fictibacillus macauensis]EIT86366.1 hypothetical protein A374_05361 [Fictibacillus macauensis ZFHKF-1]
MEETNILLRIQSVVAQLPTSERKVGHYVLHHPYEVSRMTIHELAKEAEASSSAVTRFCRSIAVPSYAELKVLLSSLRSTSQEVKGFYDIEPDEQLTSIKKKIVANSVQAIQETAHHLQEDKVYAVIEAMKEAEVIYVYGLGASWLVAQDLVHKWLRLGKAVHAHQDPHLTAASLAASKGKAVLFCISNSGETPEILQLVDIAKAYRVQTIGLTRFGTNTLEKKVNLSLQHVRAPEAPLRSAATSSLFAQLLTISMIFYAYVSKYYSEYEQEMKRSRESVRAFTQRKLER